MAGPGASTLGQLGTVTAVDRTNGKVDAILRSGQPLFEVPYTGNPPWRGLEARFIEVASGGWFCLGTSGDTGGYGPNLIPNGDFEQDVAGWDNTGSKAWNFDGTTESWVALASTSLAVSTSIVYNGTGSLQITATGAATIGATSPTGVSGVAVVPGTSYNCSGWTKNAPSKNARVAAIRIKWYQAGGAASAILANSNFGASITTAGDQWGVVAVTAIAPSDAAFAAVEINYTSAASGDIFLLDTIVLTGGTSATITRDTTVAYSGAACMRIRSAASGVCYAQCPSPATDPLSGIPVNAGEVYYADCRFRTSVGGMQLFIVAAWVFADGSTTADFDYNSRSLAGSTSAWQHHVQKFTAPSNAVAVHFAFAFIATAATQDVFLDAVRIRQGLVTPGIGLQALIPEGYTWQVGQKQMSPGTALWIPSETDYPTLSVNGYVQNRVLRGRLNHPVGGSNQSVTCNGTFVLVAFSEAESNGCFASTAANFISAPRNGTYRITGQVQRNALLATAAVGWSAVRLCVYDATGATLRKVLAATQMNHEPVTDDTWPANLSCEDTINRDERVTLEFASSHGASVQVNCLNPGAGTATGHWLTMSYIGDA